MYFSTLATSFQQDTVLADIQGKHALISPMSYAVQAEPEIMANKASRLFLININVSRNFLEPSLDPISRALARSARGQSGGLAKARLNLSEFAELQTDLARTSPTLG
ncbi:hypothetical protein B0H14DRAFT_2632956 [Mycena olivaceomarginata]|nr:hypothetical protein B0H14DRAFT_2632956 [Mycena olivaceomarginata]